MCAWRVKGKRNRKHNGASARIIAASTPYQSGAVTRAWRSGGGVAMLSGSSVINNQQHNARRISHGENSISISGNGSVRHHMAYKKRHHSINAWRRRSYGGVAARMPPCHHVEGHCAEHCEHRVVASVYRNTILTACMTVCVTPQKIAHSAAAAWRRAI